MFKIIFPVFNNQRYWEIHYTYLLNIFKFLKCDITFRANLDIDSTSFFVIINNEKFIIDFADSSEYRKLGNGEPIFKFHTKKEDLDKVIPFPPVSFYDWAEFYKLENEIKYNASGYVTSRQRPYCGALERRLKVQYLLKRCYLDVQTNLLEQVDYWKEISNIGVSVFVPGQNNNIYDRGHAQYLAFGCATISPNLPEVLPFNRDIVGNYHYIKCLDDYTDFPKLIDDVLVKPEYLKQVGENAKMLFRETSTPEKIGQWIKVWLK